MPSLLPVLALLAAPALAGQHPDVNWQEVRAEVLQHFSALLRIDTTNPPGNETRAAEYLRQVLESEGIPVRLLSVDPARANLVARLRGSGRKRPLLLMAHTDVVGVQDGRWTVEPFAAVRSGGYIYGRGAVDDKDSVAAFLVTVLLLKRLAVPLERDVIFLAEAGEEGTTSVGIDFIISKHWGEIDAEYALAEGGGGASRNGKVRLLTITTTEKTPRGITLTARGTAGHGSVPRVDNPVSRLARAVARVSTLQLPVRLNDTTRAYFERLATVSPPELATRYRQLAKGEQSAKIARHFAAKEPAHEALLRTTIVPTLIHAGFRENVIPADAEAVIDIRALPGENIPALVARIRKAIDDPEINIAQRRDRPTAPPSRIDTEAFHALERTQKRLYPEAITIPAMLAGATDLAQLRAKGVQAYGIGPVSEERDGSRHGAHGDDERILEASLYRYLEFVWNAVLEIAAEPAR